MVDLTRRKTVIGLGLLATGSGATFTSAAFNDSVEPSSDIRVVAEDELILEPGILFRDGDKIDDPVDPEAANTSSNPTLTNNSTDSLFVEDSDSVDDLGSGLNTSDDSGLDGVAELPAASVNDATDGALNLQVALPLGESGSVGDSSNGLLQVRNEGIEARDIAVRYSDFGSDVTDGPLAPSRVLDILDFKGSINSTTKNISPTDTSGTQQVNDVIELPAGETLQIFLKYDTGAGGSDIEGDLRNAGIADGNSPFSDPSTDTIDLLDSIEVGNDDGNDTAT